jgi:hypothetical protein
VHTTAFPHTCPARLILLDFTTRTILGKGYRSLSSLLIVFHNKRRAMWLRSLTSSNCSQLLSHKCFIASSYVGPDRDVSHAVNI